MKKPFKHKLAVFLLRILASTWRIKTEGNFPRKPAIVAFWHGFMLPAWKIFGGKDPVGVVSQSKDGQILSDLLEKWGFRLLRGSSSKGGGEVLESIYEEAAASYVLITPDGPTGPIYKFKAGAAVAAFKTGTPLILCGVNISSAKIFGKSWDNFRLPLPFSKTIITFDEPIEIDKNASREQVDEIIIRAEKRLNELNGCG